jgi:formiminoglutamate deiminase
MSVGYHCEHALVDGVIEPSVRVTVDAGRFTSVDVGAAPEPADRRLRGLTVPGLANAHSHAFHRALRSRTQRERGSFWTWRETMYRAAERLDPDRYHALAQAVFAEMTLAGFTAVGEFHYVHHESDGTPYADPNAMAEALFAAAEEAGIRLLLLDTLYLHGGLDGGGYAEPTGAQRRFTDGSADAWAERVSQLRSDGDFRRVGAAIHSVRAVDPDAMALVAEWSDDRQAPVHAHVSEQTAENDACHERFAITPLALLHRAGVVTDRFTAVHATHLTDHDIALLADAGSTVCMCPTTERDLGDGIGPTTRLADAGVPLSIGSDSHSVIDPFEETRAIELDERLRSRRRGVHRADELFCAATGAGHASLGWRDAGRIEVGGRADLVTVTADSVRMAGAGLGAALEALVFAATASDVTDVVIDGRAVVAEGVHVDIDVPAALDASIRSLMED